MKKYLPIIILSLFVGVIGYLFMSHENMTADVPWRTQGNFFTIEWIVPEGVAYYRCYLANDKIKITENPFSCFQVKMPPPLKPGKKQQQVIHYKLEEFSYDLYVEVFAFDIDGNYWNLDLLNFEEEINL